MVAVGRRRGFWEQEVGLITSKDAKQLTAIESVESPIPQGREEVSTIEPAGCDRVNQPQRQSWIESNGTGGR